jgi:hypothetical protein
MSKFVADADGVRPKTVEVLREYGHEVQTIPFAGKDLSAQQSIFREIFSDEKIFLTSNSALAERLRDMYPPHRHPGIIVCPKEFTDDALANRALAEIIHAVVSTREHMPRGTTGLFFRPYIGGQITSKSSRVFNRRKPSGGHRKSP